MIYRFSILSIERREMTTMQASFKQPVSRRTHMSYFADSLYARISRVLLFGGMIFSMAGVSRAQAPTPIPGISMTTGDITSVAGSNKTGTTPVPVPATSGKLSEPSGLAFDAEGNLYIADSGSQPTSQAHIYEVNTSGLMSLYAGSTSALGIVAPNGGAALGSWISGTSSLVFDSAGNLFIAASTDSVIDEIPAGMTSLQIYAGQFRKAGSTGDNGSATSAKFALPLSIAIDSANNLYVADPTNHSIRKITPGGNSVLTVAGTTGTGCTAEANCGDGGVATAAKMDYPDGVFVDGNDNIFVVDQNLNNLRVVYNGGAAVACLIALENPTLFPLPVGSKCSGPTSPVPTTLPTPGHIYFLAGISAGCSNMPCGDGQLASSAGFFSPPGGLTIDGAGNIFINDSNDVLIRKIDASTGLISSVIGSDANISFNEGFSGDNGPATSALIAFPPNTYSINALTTDTHGNLFLADTGNYNVRAVAGIAAIALTPQTITFNQSLPTVTYGASAISLTATASSGLAVTYTVTGPASVSGSTLTITGAGTVIVTANQAGNSTYAAATSVPQSFTVNRATITVAGVMVTQSEGTAAPSPLYTITGLVGTDTITGAPTVQSAYTTNSSIGNYPITVSPGNLAISPAASAANYNTPFTYTAGQITVTGGTTQTITFPALQTNLLVYGAAPIPLNATSSSGLPITYTATGSAVVTGSPSAGWTLSIISAGQGTVTAAQPGNDTYAAASSQTQVFSVKQATLTVTATSFSEPYGSTLSSSLPYTVAGLVGNDSVGGMPTLTTAYTPTTPVSTIDQIAISQGTLVIQAPALPGNYILNLVPGTITVTSGPNTITFPPIPAGNQSYGSVVTLAATASSGLPITYTVTGNATISGSKLTITGLGPITVKASQAGNANYAAATPVTQTFTATQAVLSVIVGYYTRAQGAVNPAFTATITGFVNGDADTPLVLTGAPIITTQATVASPPGNYAITPALGTLFSANYTFAFVPGTLVVTQSPSYLITASPNALTIPIGQAAQTVLDIKSFNSYQGSVTFSCGQVSIGITCTFSPATVNITYNPNNPSTANQDNFSTLTVTTSSTATAQLRAGGGSTVMAGLFLVPAGLAGLLLAFGRRRMAAHLRVHQLLVLIVLLSGVMGLGACGSSNNQGKAPLGNTTLLITATGTGTPNTGSPNTTNILYLTVDVTNLQ
jgi:hypothetical protein